MTSVSRHGVRGRRRGRWLVLGVVLWLTLASSITLEQDRISAAQWGSAATLAVLGILVLLAACRVALIPVRGLVRRVRRWVAGRFR